MKLLTSRVSGLFTFWEDHVRVKLCMFIELPLANPLRKQDQGTLGNNASKLSRRVRRLIQFMKLAHGPTQDYGSFVGSGFVRAK